MTKTIKKAAEAPLLRIRLVRSPVGYPPVQRATVRGLGLRKIGAEVVRPNSPEIRGMVTSIAHLVNVEASEEA